MRVHGKEGTCATVWLVRTVYDALDTHAIFVSIVGLVFVDSNEEIEKNINSEYCQHYLFKKQ